jgi:hypothetical protein
MVMFTVMGWTNHPFQNATNRFSNALLHTRRRRPLVCCTWFPPCGIRAFREFGNSHFVAILPKPAVIRASVQPKMRKIYGCADTVATFSASTTITMHKYRGVLVRIHVTLLIRTRCQYCDFRHSIVLEIPERYSRKPRFLQSEGGERVRSSLQI